MHCGKRSQVASHAQRTRENLAAIGTGDKCTDGVFRMRPRLSSEATAHADLSDARPPDRRPRADVVFVHGLKVRRVARRRAPQLRSGSRSGAFLRPGYPRALPLLQFYYQYPYCNFQYP